jgi:prephenate dehydrogenase
MEFQTIAIVGTGLIGGSFGLAMRKAGFEGRILGVSSERSVAEALSAGAIDEAVSLQQATEKADLLYLSQTIGGILETIDAIAGIDRPELLITDAGSTKRAIVERAVERGLERQFLGGHPMAGKETRGAAAADAGLFAGKPYVLTPTGGTCIDTPTTCAFKNYLERFGARTLVLSPAEHDRAVAFTSHLPQLISTALSTVIGGEFNGVVDELPFGPGLVDMTRLSQSSYEVWRDILSTNSKEIRHALQVYIDKLTLFGQNLTTSDVQKHFLCAGEIGAALRDKRPG